MLHWELLFLVHLLTWNPPLQVSIYPSPIKTCFRTKIRYWLFIIYYNIYQWSFSSSVDAWCPQWLLNGRIVPWFTEFHVSMITWESYVSFFPLISYYLLFYSLCHYMKKSFHIRSWKFQSDLVVCKVGALLSDLWSKVLYLLLLHNKDLNNPWIHYEICTLLFLWKEGFSSSNFLKL